MDARGRFLGDPTKGITSPSKPTRALTLSFAYLGVGYFFFFTRWIVQDACVLFGLGAKDDVERCVATIVED